MHVATEDTDDLAEKRDHDVPPEPLPIPEEDGDATSGDGAEEDHDFSSLLQHFDDAQDLDDQNAGDLDHGIDIDEAPTVGEEPEHPSLDLGEFVEAPPEDRSLLAGTDEVGPTGDASGFDGVEPPPAGADDDSEGVTDEDVAPPELHDLSVESIEEEEPPEIALEDIGVRLDDDPHGPSVLPWVEVAVPQGPARSLVVCMKGSVYAAGRDVVALDDSGAQTTLAANTGDTATSLLPIPGGSVFFTTEAGQLYRADARAPERLTAWKDAFGLEPSALALALGGPTPSTRPALLLRAGDAKKELLESTDQGSTFRRVDLGGSVVALSSGAPPVCVVKSDRAVRLLRSEPTGGFSVVNVNWHNDSEGQAIAAHGDVIGTFDSERGVLVSADGGRSFRAAAGLHGATAVAAARVGGRPVVFAAVFDSSSETTKIAYIDAVSAEAVIVAGVDASDDETGEHARVSSLAWNEGTETLWAAGPFGLRCWRRPTSA